MLAKELEFFKDLSQLNYNSEYYDFHNDYDLKKITLEDEVLSLCFCHSNSNFNVSLNFHSANIVKVAFSNVVDIEYLSIDSIYRGRAEINSELKEFSNECDEDAYFYLECYEGQKIEFWAKSISVEKLG